MLVYDVPQDLVLELSEDVEILHQGSKSVVFHRKESNNCIKVGISDNITAEWYEFGHLNVFMLIFNLGGLIKFWMLRAVKRYTYLT